MKKEGTYRAMLTERTLIIASVAISLIGLGALLIILQSAELPANQLTVMMPYRTVVISINCFILVLTPLLAGWLGLLVLVTSTALGILPATVKVARVHAMGCLLLPVILFFLA
jgi:TctA family transporter